MCVVSRLRGLLIMLPLLCGGLVCVDSEAWAKANRADAVAERKRLDFLIAPLFGPNPANVKSLDKYLREAFWRVNPMGIEGGCANAVIPKSDEPDKRFYKLSVDWLSVVLLKDAGGDRNVSIAAMPSDDPFKVLRDMVAPLKAGSLKHLTIYFMATDAQWPDVEQIFAGRGAKLVQLNPEKPILQRPERLIFFLRQRAEAAR